MGHLAGSKSALTPLIDRLNRYPIGLVDSARLREILSLLFDDTESFVGSRFPLHEATLEELVERTGLSPEHLQPVLERMADKGLVMDLPYAGTTYYLLVPGLIGFMEFTFMRRRTDLPLAELARLMSEYLQEKGQAGQAGEFFGSRTPLTRALVHDAHIPVSSRITAYEDARRIIQAADFCAVTLCYCRHKKEHLGETCRKGAPVEDICMVLGEGARFLVRRGFAQERDKASHARHPGVCPLARPHPCHRQRPRAAVLHLQLLPLLLRADGGRPTGLQRRDRQDALPGRDRPGALQLLRRLPQDLQRQGHRSGARRPSVAQGRALRRRGYRRLPRLRRLHPGLRAGGDSSGRAPPATQTAQDARSAVRAHPVGEGPPLALCPGSGEATVALSRICGR